MWLPHQFLAITGLDQVWVFDEKYFYLMLAFVGVSALRVIHAFRAAPAERVRPLLLLCLLCAAGVVILPARVQLPGYQHALAFIAERMSLPLAVCLVGVMALVPSRPVERYASIALAVVFFGFLYRDERMLNAFEDRVQAMIAQAPQGQRVISGVSAPMLRVDAVGHMVDRACAGHCYSYANYEPSTSQFRIRVRGPNPAVAPTYLDSWQMQAGGYIVKDIDLPLDQLIVDDRGRMAIQQLVAGQQIRVSDWNPLEN
jgi:hypothetical protein